MIKNHFKVGRIVPIIYFLFLAFVARTQHSNVRHDSLYSQVLKEKRNVEIIFPKKYIPNATDKFDVLYVLDGEWNTSLVEKLYEFQEYAKFVPTNMLIVNVPNLYRNGVNMRDRDFTPSTKEGSISGGANNFLGFLKNELIPFVNKKYPTRTENNILYGTSLGGLFAIYSYLHEPALFKSYLTVEPSLWWDNEYLHKIASKKLGEIKDSKNTLWIANRDGNAYRDMGIFDFDSILLLKAPTNLSWKIETYPNETHFSAIWKGVYDGLRFTYLARKTQESPPISTKTNIGKSNEDDDANTEKKFKTENGKYISFSKMDEFLKTQMDSIGVPGLSFAIINSRKIIYHRTFGVKNMETKQKVTNETIFDAASMTKTPFAFLIMKLKEKGILDLDTPLYTYLPYPDIASDDRYKLITARMVLSHTTGFPNWRFFNKDGKLDIKFTPGTQFLYSGEGYEYLANVVAHIMKIHKNDIQDLFKKEITEPLKMNNVFFTWNDSLAKLRATGHVDGKVAPGYGIDAQKPGFYASYSMQAEAASYARLLIAMIYGEGLRKENYDDMFRVQFPNASKSGDDQWGLGIAIKPTKFGDEYFHDGFNLNFSSCFMFNREQKFGYVFFTNCNKASELNKRLLTFFSAYDE